jgi:hypothetical protein
VAPTGTSGRGHVARGEGPTADSACRCPQMPESPGRRDGRPPIRPRRRAPRGHPSNR